MWSGELTAQDDKVTVNTDVVCLNDTITFTLEGDFTDSGGLKRVDCTPTTLGPSIKYEWTLTLPIDYPQPPPPLLPIPLTGEGQGVSIEAKVVGDYSATFKVSTPRDCPASSITLGMTANIAELAFSENSTQAYGFDDYTNRDDDQPVPFKSVENGLTDTVTLTVGSMSIVSEVFLSTSNSLIVLPSPTSVTSSPATVTLSGVAPGEASVFASLDSPSTFPCATIDVTVYNRRDKTVSIILVHEENDDVQVIGVGDGTPNITAIRVGPDGVLNSTPGGDDWIKVLGGEEIIVTGLNGKCETTASGDDVQIISVGQGKPNQTCVGLGGNSFRDTNNVDVNDTLDASGINTGPDGICNSVADNTNVLSTNFGTAASIQAFLNNVIYNQAVVTWDVVKERIVTVNFDLNRDGLFDNSFCMNPEMEAIVNAAQDPSSPFNVYLVDNPFSGILGNECDPRRIFVYVGTHDVGDSVGITIAHELGHAQDMPNHPDQLGDPDTENLMHSTDGGEKLRKGQWDSVQNSTP